MDLSLLSDALSSESYSKIAQICDNLMLQAAAEGIAYQDHWPYATHLLAHLFVDDVNSARFLWKSIPGVIKERQPEIVAVWGIGQKLWVKDYAGVHVALGAFDWGTDLQGIVAAFKEKYTRSIFELLLSAYSTISIEDTALFLGMSKKEATKYVLEQGWTLDPSSHMLTVERRVVSSEQKVDPSKLQRLTEYVFHLEH